MSTYGPKITTRTNSWRSSTTFLSTPSKIKENGPGLENALVFLPLLGLSFSKQKDPKLQLGAIPLHPDHTLLILSTKGPNRTRFLASQPSTNCSACSSIIRHYNCVKKSLHVLKQELDNTICCQWCEKANSRFISKNKKCIEESTTTYLEIHLRTHHNCGTILDIPHTQLKC